MAPTAWTACSPEHPGTTAVLGYNDLIAAGAMRRALCRGPAVPGDCAFVGCDGLMFGELMDPPLTTLHVGKRQPSGSVENSGT
ncbi:substrate-binding domain-containing protein [Streptomyces sp. NPDC056656]|uniref:substrate-binding domain-containing protein n=1 Tax=Streptomyces sp. NPDC056656 TaxID=3345895 RepID=UPI0036A6706E